MDVGVRRALDRFCPWSPLGRGTSLPFAPWWEWGVDSSRPGSPLTFSLTQSKRCPPREELY